MNEFIGSLNTIDPQDTTADYNTFINDDDLAMFSGSTFFDFDQGQTVSAQPANFDFSGNAESKGMEFMNGGMLLHLFSCRTLFVLSILLSCCRANDYSSTHGYPMGCGRNSDVGKITYSLMQEVK